VLPTATDNANVTVARLGGRHVALTETPRMVVFDPETLLTFGSRTFDDAVPGQWTAAHLEHDRARGETVGLTVDFGRTSSYHVYRLSDGARAREAVARIRTDEPAYVHSIGLTDRYVVLPEVPFTADPRRFLSPDVDAFVDAFEWDEDRPARFHVVDRDDGTVSTVDGPPFFFFHTVNAFERSDEVVVDLVAFPDASVVDALAFDRVERGVREATGDLRRFRLPLDGGWARGRTLATDVALARTSPLVRRRPYRYAYAQRTDDDATGVVRVDVERETERVWRAPDCFAGEPVFVPRDGPSGGGADTIGTGTAVGEEVGGVVLSVVLDRDAERSFLLVLDAATMAERARAWLPHALPLGFHGEYFAEA
jgi:carotenoid cleavage dioxygenase-like enzyme